MPMGRYLVHEDLPVERNDEPEERRYEHDGEEALKREALALLSKRCAEGVEKAGQI
jgi:hypothetical protein